MGYSTKLDGQFMLDRPLTIAQKLELDVFANTRQPVGAPGYYCQWVPTEDGTGIEWDGRGNFYDYVEWLEYLVEHFLRPWGYVLKGEVRWSGERPEDLGLIRVVDNIITSHKATITYGG